jgi:squalene-hopene/tetraprenyl-beta-curcumene cyclase
VEETALAVEALLSAPSDPRRNAAIDRGLEWLITAVEQERHRECSPIGLYFAKLWYYEELYPTIFTVATLGQALRRTLPRADAVALPAHFTC